MLMKGMTLVMMIFAVLKIFLNVSKAGEIHVFKSVCLSKAPEAEILFDSDNDEPSSELLLQDHVYHDGGDGSAVVAAAITSRWCNCSSGRAAIIRVMRKPHHHHKYHSHHHLHHHHHHWAQAGLRPAGPRLIVQRVQFSQVNFPRLASRLRRSARREIIIL